jgi:hypothetical protein
MSHVSSRWQCVWPKVEGELQIMADGVTSTMPVWMASLLRALGVHINCYNGGVPHNLPGAVSCLVSPPDSIAEVLGRWAVVLACKC